MKLNSLSLRTNMIFTRNEGEIIERESYIVIKTMSNPSFHWGNYLIFKRAPQAGDIDNWIKIFHKEFSHYKTFEHYVFAWDELVEPKSPEYLVHQFDLEKSVSLKTNELHPPKHLNSKVIVRPLVSDKDWDDADELQTLTREPRFSYAEYKEFKVKQSQAYRKLVAKNRGARFGAFIDNVIVGDLGIYFEDDLARYQSVVTHPDYRGMGVCGTLVYLSGKYAFENWNILTLAMEADPDYHAARIYESVGFFPTENSYSLYWHKSKV